MMVLPLRRPDPVPKPRPKPRPRRSPYPLILATTLGAAIGASGVLAGYALGWRASARHSNQEAFYRVLSDALQRAQRAEAMADSLGADYVIVRDQLRQERKARIRAGVPSTEIKP
jgi:hypothetical protein